MLHEVGDGLRHATDPEASKHDDARSETGVALVGSRHTADCGNPGAQTVLAFDLRFWCMAQEQCPQRCRCPARQLSRH